MSQSGGKQRLTMGELTNESTSALSILSPSKHMLTKCPLGISAANSRRGISSKKTFMELPKYCCTTSGGKGNSQRKVPLILGALYPIPRSSNNLSAEELTPVAPTTKS